MHIKDPTLLITGIVIGYFASCYLRGFFAAMLDDLQKDTMDELNERFKKIRLKGSDDAE